MCFSKLCSFATLASVLAFAAVGSVNTPKSEVLPIPLLPAQSRDIKSLGAGKVLVASRNLGDPNFAETVILLVRYDAQGVVGLVLNRRTISRFRACSRTSRPQRIVPTLFISEDPWILPRYLRCASRRPRSRAVSISSIRFI